MASVLPGKPATEIPPLENGDRLTRAEFERRYHAMPHVKKAELIGGVVYMPSPTRHVQHGRPHGYLHGWLTHYVAPTPGTETGNNSSVRLDDENEPQPDSCLFILPDHGGQATVDDEGYLAGAPELAAEVAASSVSYDLHAKLDTYRDHGVREYVVWRVLDAALDWFVLREGKYEPLTPAADGILRSAVFPGLWLDAGALLAGDLARVFQVVQQGTASTEHQEFVARLRACRN